VAGLLLLAPLAAPAQSAPEIRAQLSPLSSTVLSGEIAGTIEELPLREGDRFKAGDRLVAFDCTLHRARLSKANAQQDEARKTFEVNKRLDKLGSVSTLELDAAQARLAAAQAETAMMKAMVERCAIAAPFPGRVAAMNVRRYQYVAEGEPLIEILDDRELEVEMIVPSRWLTWLAAGTGFVLHVEETDRDYPAEVTRLSARIDPVSQSIKVFGRVLDGQAELLSGMSGRALFSPPGG
jgi:RND family efflux transporter MFP subunit